MMKYNIRAILFYIIVLIISGALGIYLGNTDNEENEIDTSQLETEITRTFHSPVTFVQQLKGDPDAGRKIFIEFCSSCHGKIPPIDVNAPRIGDKKIWGALSQVGLSALLNMTINGAGAMPARGGCFECSDEQLRETIQYILSQSR